jgi:thiamine transporter ThiT
MEHVLGGINHAGGLKQLKAKGQFRVGAVFLQYMLAFNLIGLASLLSQSPKEVLA